MIESIDAIVTRFIDQYGLFTALIVYIILFTSLLLAGYFLVGVVVGYLRGAR